MDCFSSKSQLEQKALILHYYTFYYYKVFYFADIFQIKHRHFE